MKLHVDGQHMLGEGVLWCARTQRLLWTDIPAATLWSVASSGVVYSWPMPERLASFALTSDPDWLLLGLASRLVYFHLPSGQIKQQIVQVEAALPTTRTNDGRCDRQGRFVFGTMNEHPDQAAIGSFYRLNLDLTLERLPLPNVAIANSICFSPDGSRMYYCDSLTNAIRCCDYHADGTIRHDRVFIEAVHDQGAPDGSLIDSEGFLWNANWGGARVVRFNPAGEIDRVIAVPSEQPTCVAFGGAQLNQLHVTTARQDLSAAQLAHTPHAGGVFVRVVDDVVGLPESRFAGALP
jgi:L-arabinonolactonase